MACSSCGTKSGGCAPKGCKSNGTCGTSGCNALNVYDWFKDMELPDGYQAFNVVEIRFKGSRKEFFRNTHGLDLFTGDHVVIESSIGYDVGTVSATGEIVRLQLKKYRVREDDEEMRAILRVATEKDMEKYEEAKSKENATLERARTIAFSLNLQMKISDIEMQGDGRKVIFFYTAESRVDFRELIRKYADEFKVKIEMRHISYREEASRLGGTGVCGRELCCSTWLTDYKQVNTGAARVQNLSINMEKLSGQCGRLKCCLNYELDQYVEAIDTFPKAKIVKLDTVNGVAYARKTDILKKLIWFSYEDSQTWVALEVDKVNECMEENKLGKQVAQLQDLAPASAVLEKIQGAREDVADFIGNDELLSGDDGFKTGQFDRPKNNRDHRNNRGGDRNDRRPGGDNRDRNHSQNRNHPPREHRPNNNNERRDRNPAQGDRNNRPNQPNGNSGNPTQNDRRPQNPNQRNDANRGNRPPNAQGNNPQNGNNPQRRENNQQRNFNRNPKPTNGNAPKENPGNQSDKD